MKSPLGILVARIERVTLALGITQAARKGIVRLFVTSVWFGLAAGADYLAQNVAGIGLPEYLAPLVAAAAIGLSKWARSR